MGILGLRARLEAFDRRIAREVIEDARAREEHEQYEIFLSSFFLSFLSFLLLPTFFLLYCREKLRRLEEEKKLKDAGDKKLPKIKSSLLTVSSTRMDSIRSGNKLFLFLF